MITVTYSEMNDDWTVKKGHATRRFLSMAMGVAFGNPRDQRNKHHCVVVGGLQPDGTIDILDGVFGPIDHVKTACIDYKDLYWIKRVITPSEPDQLIEQLEELEGLCKYEEKTIPFTTRKRPVSPPETWKHFRCYEHKAQVEFVAPEIEDDMESACIRFEELTQAGRLRIPKKEWTALWRETRKPLEEGIRSSTLRAAVILAAYFDELWEMRKRRKGLKKETIDRPYGSVL